MNHSIKNIQLFFLFQLFLISFVYSQSDFQKIFDEGVIHYRNGNFDQAKLKFMTITTTSENNAFITSGYFMLAKSNEKLKKYRETIVYADNILNQYPESKYIADAHFLKAIAHYKLDNPAKSIQDLSMVIESSNFSELTKKSELYATQMVQNGIQLDQLTDVYNSKKWDKAEPMLLLWLARTCYENGKKSNGDKYANQFLSAFPNHRYAQAAKNLKNTPIDQLSKKIRIGVVLPVTGLFSAEATDLLRGLIFSLKDRKSSSPQIQLFLKDTRGSTAETVKSTLNLLDQDINLLIGELESSNSATIAGLVSTYNIPLLIPVATENGLSTINSMVFQMNNDLETRGIKLAEYAYNNLGLKTFATLAPADEYGHALTDAFLNQVDKLGGSVLSEQWYYPGTPDLKRQFDAIRESGIRFALRDTIINNNLPVTPQRLDSLFRSIDRYVKRNSEDYTGVVETYDIPISTIDGVFMPTYKEDIEIVAPQFVVANLDAKSLGGDYWNDGDVLRKQRNYLNGTVFIAGNYISETDIEYRDFVNRFRLLTSSSPSIMALYGYNIMNLLIDAIDQGKSTTEEFVAFLENQKQYQGLGGKFSFSKDNHSNQSVNILQFQDGNIYDVYSEELKLLLEEK